MGWTYVVTAAIGLLLFVVLYVKRRYEYWSSKGIYQFEPTWFFGNTKAAVLGQKNFGEVITNLYEEIRTKGLNYAGAYFLMRPVFIPVEPELIKQIMTSDFQSFNSHASLINERENPLSANLFNLEGSRWKSLRSKLTPTFTSGKIKMMFATIQACTVGLENMLEDYEKSKEAVDIKDVLGRFTTDVIGSCAFGINCNSIKDPNTDFRVMGKKVFDSGRLHTIKNLIISTMPKVITDFLKLSAVDKDVTNFFFKIVKDTVKYREENNVARKDFMHLLLQLKNKGKVSDDDDFKGQKGSEGDSVLDINEIVAQAFVFFVAGFETSSTAMTFALCELALNQDVQDKLRTEINNVLKKYDGEVTYDAVSEMHYLNRVVDETLRLHSAAMTIPRACTKDWKIPGTDAIIEKGTIIQIPVLGLHLDPEYYENPKKFDPDRFTEENKAKRPAFTYLPFGEGPRICIGLRFGLLQTKIGLISVVRNFRVTLNEKTVIPLQIDPNNLVNAVKGGVWVNVTKA